MLPKIEYLGHVISAEGLHPAKDKIRAILEAPAPSSVAQLRSFLGMVNYYGKFLPQLSSLLAPLYSLLQKQAKWHWGPDQEQAFTKVKHLMTSSKLLVHYDPVKELVLSCDASPYGVGAVLSHIMEDGSEKPIAFASRSLAAAEKKYSQLDLLQPDTTSNVLDKQTTQKLNHDKHTKERSFEVSDPVLVYNFSNGPKWLSGTIIKLQGNRNYTIELTDGRIVRRHVDHLRSQVPDLTVEAQEDIPLDLVPTQVEQTTRSHAVPVRRSTRVSRSPDRYTPSSI